MAQLTGTEIVAAARVHAQDNDANSNYYVSDADALVLLNDILALVTSVEENRPKYLAASATGLTFAAGTVTALTTAGVNLAEVLEAAQSATSSAPTPTRRTLERVSVAEWKRVADPETDGTVPGASTSTATEFTHFAAERVTGGSGEWRFYVWPPLAAQSHLVVKASQEVVLSSLTGTPDLTPQNARWVSRMLAADIARLSKRPQAFVDGILSRLPRGWLDRVLDAAHKRGQGQQSLRERGED